MTVAYNPRTGEFRTINNRIKPKNFDNFLKKLCQNVKIFKNFVKK